MIETNATFVHVETSVKEMTSQSRRRLVRLAGLEDQ